ncbi:uncharacterized protein JCM6883_005739 [Sporobolomyces salmoneus]|uniref:uncharacterized protein n=1 Tax=Sporobolomyces salmoneus TaxID=183962 RepID=UPI00317DFE47
MSEPQARFPADNPQFEPASNASSPSSTTNGLPLAPPPVPSTIGGSSKPTEQTHGSINPPSSSSSKDIKGKGKAPPPPLPKSNPRFKKAVAKQEDLKEEVTNLEGSHHQKPLAPGTDKLYVKLGGYLQAYLEVLYDDEEPEEIAKKMFSWQCEKEITEAEWKGYALATARAIVGQFEDGKPQQRTLVKTVELSFVLYERTTGHAVNKYLRTQVANYLESEILEAQKLTTTEMRPKHRLQFSLVTLLLVDTSSRPGELILCKNYADSEMAEGKKDVVKWKDCEWIVDSESGTPILSVKLTIRLLKGHREDKSKSKSFFLRSLPDQPLLTDTFSQLLALALADKVFASPIESIADLLNLRPRSTSEKLVVPTRPEVAELAIFRGDETRDGVWTTSERYLDFQRFAQKTKEIGRIAGFEADISPYIWRRTSLNNLNSSLAVTQADRTQISGHAPGSHVFEKAYQSTTARVDVQQVQRGQSGDHALVQNLDRLQRVEGMPTELSVAGRDRILAREEYREVNEKLESSRVACIKSYGSLDAARSSGSPDAIAYDEAQRKIQNMYLKDARIEFKREKEAWI